MIIGDNKDTLSISYAHFFSSDQLSFTTNLRDIFSRATPPPGSIPSTVAERTAHTASSIRSYSSFCSRSVLPPAYITPTPPVKEAIRDSINSRSAFLSVISCASRSSDTRLSISSLDTTLSSLIIIDESLPTIIFLALPKSLGSIRLRSSPVF